MKKFYLSILATVIVSLGFFSAVGQAPIVSITGTPCINNTLTLNSSVLPTKIAWTYNGNPLSTATNSWQSNAQVLITVGDTGVAISSFCMDASNNLYYTTNNLGQSTYYVYKLAPGATSPIVVAGAGAGGSGNNQLKAPVGVFIDGSNNLYIADAGNNRIMKWVAGASTGTMVAGTGTAGSGNNQLNNPTGVFVDGSGNIYVADAGNNRVMEWTSGVGSLVAGTGTAGSANNQLNAPYAIFVDKINNLFIADQNNNRIMKWASGGTSGTVVAGGNGLGDNPNQLSGPTGVYVDGLGNIYVADANNNRVQEWATGASTGTTIAGGNGSGNAANQFLGLRSIILDSSSNLYASDFWSGRLDKFASVINNTITPTLTGTYSAAVTINAGSITNTSYIVYPAPTINTQPVDKTICSGTNTTFSLVATTGPGALYQWQLNNGSGVYTNLSDAGVYSGTTTNTLSLTGVTDNMSGYVYKCMVTGACPPGITSNSVTLTVDTLPVIKVQPVASTICAGNNTSFSTTAAGTGITYQWWVRQGASGNFSPVSGSVYTGATTNTLNITAAPATMNGYTYHCIVTGTCNPTATTTDVVLTVSTSPVVILQPQNTTQCANNTATFTVTVTGTAPSYQWQVNTGSGTYTNITNTGIYNGSNTNTLTIAPVSINMSGYHYQCFVGGTCTPPVTTNSAVLTVDTLPNVLAQPVNSTICAGNNTNFSISAAGTGISYQWQVKVPGGNFASVSGSIYSGATTNALTLTNVPASNNQNQYRCVVNGFCTTPATSTAATLTVNTAPAISPSSQPVNTTVCSGQNATFSVAATGTDLTYQWQENTGSGFVNVINNSTYSGATTNALSIAAATIGMNNNTYQVVVSGACTPVLTSGTGLLNVNPTPAPVIATSGITMLCPGDSVTLSVPAVIGDTYQWLHGSGNTPITGATDPAYTSKTTDVYTVTVTNTYHCAANAAPVSVALNDTPQVVILHPGPLCSGINEVLYATSNPNWTYQWFEGATLATIPGANFSNYTANDAGIYTVKVTNAQGCVTTPAPVTINQSPTAQISMSGSVTVCSGDTLNLNSSGVDLTYQWLVNGNPDVNGTQVDYTARIHAAGISHYAVVVTASGCSDTSATLTVNANPLPPATITLYGPPTLCNSANVALLANAAALNHTLSYQWQYNNADVQGAVYPSYLATAVGDYTLKTSDNTGCFGRASVTITADAPFTPQIILNGSDLCADSNVAYVFYQWSLNGVVITGANNKCYMPLVNGPYTLTAKDSAGCSNTSAAYNVTNVGVANVNMNDAIRMYPNPAANIVHIDAPVVVNISIMSIEGRVVLHKDAAKDVDLTQLANGVYMVAIYDVNNVLIKNEKLVKSGW